MKDRVTTAAGFVGIEFQHVVKLGQGRVVFLSAGKDSAPRTRSSSLGGFLVSLRIAASSRLAIGHGAWQHKP